jgi:phosphoenolpyruvate-protein kinase (PTS system EI component)
VTGVRGIGVSAGRASGPVVLLASRRTEPVEDPALALELVATDLEELAAELEGEPAEILLSQAAMARDPELSAAAAEGVAAGRSAAEALEIASEPYRAALSVARGEYQRERAADIEEVIRRAVGRIEGLAEAERTPPVPGILVGTRISPADTAAVPLRHLLGIVSAEGGAKSHAAIVARSLGVPAVAGVDPAQLAGLSAGEWIEIDGDEGWVQVLAGDSAGGRTLTPTRPSPIAQSEVEVDDRFAARVRANVGSVAEAELAASVGLRSAGLVRTEFLLADRAAFAVERQVELYRSILERLPGEVVFRLLDSGADKPHPGIPVVDSPNPALGLRGARLLLRNPELPESQLRALCRLGEPERVSVLVPMITRTEELSEIRRLAERVFEEEGVRLAVGSMIEVPVAALSAAELAKESDFLSIGTNDLLQYLFAADRAAAELDHLIEPLPPSAWRLLRSVIDAAVSARTPIGICGELAADETACGALLALGADYISIGPAGAASVRASLAARSDEEWSELAQELA